MQTNHAQSIALQSGRRVWFVRAVCLSVLAVLLVPLLAVPALATDLGAPVDKSTWAAQMRQRVFGLRTPGSVQGASLGGSSSTLDLGSRVAGTQRAAHVSATLNKVAITQATFSTSMQGPNAIRKAGTRAVGAAGSAASAAFAFDLGYNIGGAYMEGVFGIESNGFACDIGSIVGAGCDLVADPLYVSNSDVGTVTPPGWSADPWVGYWWQNCGTGSGCSGGTLATGSAMLDVASAPPYSADTFATPHPTAQLRFLPDSTRFNPSATNKGNLFINGDPTGHPASSSPSITVQAKCRVVATGVIETCSMYGGAIQHGAATSVPGGGSAPPAPLSPIGTSAGRVFDHILVRSGGADLYKWYPEGHTLRPPVESPDPDRRWVTTFKCDNGSPSTVTGDPWRESSAEWPAPLEPTCTTGSLTYVKVEQVAAGLDPWVLYEWSTPAEVQTWAGSYPECTTGGCVLELHRLDAATGTRLACFDNPEACLGWFESPAKADEYVCTYGTHTLALDECNTYSVIFDPKRATTGGTFADPLTGEAPAPGTGTPADPDAGCGAAPAFEFTLGGIGYWIAHGTEWALCEAFVPEPVQWADLSDKSPLPEVRSAVEAWQEIEEAGTGSECLVIGVDLPLGWGRAEVLDTCGTDPGMVWLRQNRGLLAAAVWLSFGAGVAGWAWRTYAPGAGGTT